MTGRRLLVIAWSVCATAALAAVVLVSGAGRSLPDLGPPLDLDSPTAGSSTSAAPSTTAAPTPVRSVKVQSRPPVRVPAPPPTDDDGADDGADDDDAGEEPDDGD